jgi:hypothetical protein
MNEGTTSPAATPSAALRAGLAHRYRLEWELGQGGMATVSAAESRDSADVASATSSGHSLESHDA